MVAARVWAIETVFRKLDEEVKLDLMSRTVSQSSD